MKNIKQPLYAIKVIQQAAKDLKINNEKIGKAKENFDKEWNKWGIVPKKGV